MRYIILPPNIYFIIIPVIQIGIWNVTLNQINKTFTLAVYVQLGISFIQEKQRGKWFTS